MDLKGKFLASAYYLFTTQGYQATTVADIIRHAGGSIGGFYHHYNSKEEVLDAVLDQTFDGVRADFDAMFASGDATAAKLFNSVFLSVCATDRSSFNAWSRIGRILIFHEDDAFLKRLTETFEAVTTDLYESVIQRGVDSGVFTVRHIRELANLWTREILHILHEIRQIVSGAKPYDEKSFNALLEFAEDLFSYALGLKYYKLRIAKVVLDFLQAVTAEKASDA